MSEQITKEQWLKEWAEEASGSFTKCPSCENLRLRLEDMRQHAKEWEDSSNAFEKALITRDKIIEAVGKYQSQISWMSKVESTLLTEFLLKELGL